MFSSVASSHSGSTSYFEFENKDESDLYGDWYVALQDLDLVLGLDLDQDGSLSWGEFQAQEEKLVSYAQAHIAAASSGGDCEVDIGVPVLSQMIEGVYARIPLRIICLKNEIVSSLRYSAIFSEDFSHRGVLKLIKQADPEGDADQKVSVFIFSPDTQQIFFDPKAGASFFTSFEMLKQGVIHILEGYDHLLFLLALLIPLALGKGVWRGTKKYKAAFNLFKVISAFTFGHSVTLVLAVVFDLRPPVALVESLIAVSVVVAGLNIVWPLFRESSWRIAIGFGLIHGFGFASVLRELNLSSSALASSLFTFNVGVEVGQLLVVIAALPVLILIAMQQTAVSIARPFVAIAIISMGTFWLVERGF